MASTWPPCPTCWLGACWSSASATWWGAAAPTKSFVRPPLTAAVPGDLSLTLPKRQLDNIIEMIYQLDKIAPGTANYDTLLYGAEVKFYSARLALSNELETALPGFFAVGDGAGVTRGLAQAGASGVKVAQVISERLK